MRTVEVKLYQYNELSEEAKEKAREWYREGNEYPFLYEYMQERLAELFEEYKITDKGTELHYSLSYCQGDGASFTGDIEWKAWRATIGKNSWGTHYEHSKSVDVKELNSLKTDKDAPDETWAKLQSIVEEIGDKLASDGYDYIEYEDSDENVAELIEANEYEFLEDGTRA